MRRYGLLHETRHAIICWAPGPRQKPVILKAFFDEDGTGHTSAREVAALNRLSGLQGVDVPQLFTTFELQLLQFPMLPVAMQRLPGQTAQQLGMHRDWFREHPAERQAVLDMYQRVWDAGVVHGDVDYTNWIRVPGDAGGAGDNAGDDAGNDTGDAGNSAEDAEDADDDAAAGDDAGDAGNDVEDSEDAADADDDAGDDAGGRR